MFLHRYKSKSKQDLTKALKNEMNIKENSRSKEDYSLGSAGSEYSQSFQNC